MVTNQRVRKRQEKSTIPLSCYLQIWLMLGSCSCNQCYRQQTARQAQMNAWSSKNQHISSAASLKTKKYSDPSLEFGSASFCKSATRLFHCNFIRRQYWPPELYTHTYMCINQQSQMLQSNSTGIHNTRSHHPWKQKTNILPATRRWDYRKIALFRWCLCSVQMGYWAFLLIGKIPKKEIILKMKIPLMFVWWKNSTSP